MRRQAGGALRVDFDGSTNAGKPLVRVSALTSPQSAQMKRVGFLLGQMTVPDDFDRMDAAKIETLFGSV
jgi:hypothetical protein